MSKRERIYPQSLLDVKFHTFYGKTCEHSHFVVKYFACTSCNDLMR